MNRAITSAGTDRVGSRTVSTEISLIWTERRVSPLLTRVAILAGLFALAVLLQYLSGAFHTEFGAYPDEPAHYVTSLMLREYITGPHPVSPLRFAEAYYHHYPKVAFGHWPPVFYIVQAFWMLVFSASRVSVRLEVAFTTALLALSVWSEFRRWFRSRWALLCAVLLVCLPIVQCSTDQEMAETLLVFFCFWSSIYFVRYLESAKRSDSLWFGLCFSLAVLTKGSGWLLTLVPPIALVLTRRFDRLWRPSFWAGILLIGALCLPWQLATLHSAERGWTAGSDPSVGYTLSALAEFLGILVSFVGPILSVLVAIGIAVEVLVPVFSRAVSAMPAVMFALIVADWVFHALVPAGVEDRKMILAVPGLIYFLFAGGFWLADRLPVAGSLRRWRRGLVAVSAGIVFAAQVFAITPAEHYGYLEASQFVVSEKRFDKSTMLVSSGSIGEGLFISEVAMREPRPRKIILRATKELAKVDWTGTHYESFFSNPAELLQYLRKAHVDAIILDTYQTPTPFPHQQLVERTIGEDPSGFKLLGTFPGHANHAAGLVKVYEVLPLATPRH